MSQTSSQPQPTPAGREESLARLQAPLPPPTQRSSAAWQGWTYFGAAVMALMGLFWAVMGFVALFDKAYFAFRTNRLLAIHDLAIHDYAPWGWVHLGGGLLALAAGAGLLWGGHRWARIAGVVVAALSAVVNLGFLAATPAWSTLLITLDVVVIFALTVHGWEVDDR
jgi:hypothetical protein